jgi:hypothetical protein
MTLLHLSPRHKCVTGFFETCLIMDTIANGLPQENKKISVDK